MYAETKLKKNEMNEYNFIFYKYIYILYFLKIIFYEFSQTIFKIFNYLFMHELAR